MSEGGMYSSPYSIISEAAGVAGNLCAFVLFVSPIPTFKRIVRNKSTEQFSGLPYIYALLNCLICLWYGSPVVSTGLLLIATVNSIGAVFQLVYIVIFVVYADHGRRLKMVALLLGVFGVFAVIVSVSLCVFEPPNRQLFVGYLSVFSLISMFASPLFIINLVIRTKSVEYMPYYLSLATFLMSVAFFAYGMLKHDSFVSVSPLLLLSLMHHAHQTSSSYAGESKIVDFFTTCINQIPNGIGAVLGITQLVLYFHYSRSNAEVSRAPLLEAYAA